MHSMIINNNHHSWRHYNIILIVSLHTCVMFSKPNKQIHAPNIPWVVDLLSILGCKKGGMVQKCPPTPSLKASNIYTNYLLLSHLYAVQDDLSNQVAQLPFALSLSSSFLVFPHAAGAFSRNAFGSLRGHAAPGSSARGALKIHCLLKILFKHSSLI